jgi:hypothetical protein
VGFGLKVLLEILVQPLLLKLSNEGHMMGYVLRVRTISPTLNFNLILLWW